MMHKPNLRWVGFLVAVCLFLQGCGSPQSPPQVVEIPISGNEVPDEGAPVSRPREHVVNRGETLGEIAFAYGLSHTDLALWNNLANPDLIEVGQRLQLHPPANQPEIKTVVKVAKVKPVVESEAKTQTQQGQVTRSEVKLGGQRKPSPDTLVSEPKALKINYSRQSFNQLLSNATGGSEQASLTIRENTNTTSPQNQRSVNGITWSWPVNGRLVEKFTENNRGIDITGPRGQPVHAAADGKVIYAGSGLKGFGQLIIIKHSNEYLSMYAHNDSILVAEGEDIKRGTKIAEMGDSGSDRIGLHFGIRRGEQAYNPQQFLPKTP